MNHLFEMRLRRWLRQLAAGSAVACVLSVLLIAPILVTSVVAPDVAHGTERPGPEQAADELLQDGLDALDDSRADLARQIFQELQSQYPGTVQAGRAALELEQLAEAHADQAVAPVRGQAAVSVRRQQPSRLAELRRKFVMTVGDRVFFSESSDEIGGRARAIIEQQARWLAANPSLSVTLIGRADDGGSEVQARRLSEQRADAVRVRLIEAGLTPSRILVDARGAADPIATCRTALCKAQNRHAETLIGDPKQAADAGPADAR